MPFMQNLSKKDKYNIGIIGATGLVGRSLIKEQIIPTCGLSSFVLTS